MGALTGGSRTPSVVEGDASYDASYASWAQYYRTVSPALHALRRLSIIASAFSHYRERIPNDFSTCGEGFAGKESL